MRTVTHTHTHTHTYAHTHTHIHTQMRILLPADAGRRHSLHQIQGDCRLYTATVPQRYIHTHTHTYTHLHELTHTYIHLHIYTHLHNLHKLSHSHTYTHTYTRKGGFRAFYPGLGINSLKCIPEAGLQFVLFDFGKRVVMRDDRDDDT
jgi:hypothetical protein